MASLNVSRPVRHRKAGFSSLRFIGFVAFFAAIIAIGFMAFAPHLVSAQDSDPILISISESVGISEATGSTRATQISLQETIGIAGSIVSDTDVKSAPAGRTATQTGDGGAIGRGFVGGVIEIGETSLTIESKGLTFQLAITDDTIINNPPDFNIGIGGLLVDSFFRVAGSVDVSVTDKDGNLNQETLTAQRITVIPGKATRTHKRTFVAEKKGEDLTLLDSDGKQSEVPGGGDIEQGDNVVMLVRSGGRDGKEQVKGLINSKKVDSRLERFVQELSTDEDKNNRMRALLNKRDQSLEDQLGSMADKTGAEFGQMVRDAARKLNARRNSRNTNSGRASLNTEPIPATGGDRGGRAGLNTEPIPATGGKKDDAAPRVSIITPQEGVAILGILIAKPLPIIVKADDDDKIVSVEGLLIANDAITTLVFENRGTAGLPGMDWRTTAEIPQGTRSFTVEVTATDSIGQTATDSQSFRVQVGGLTSIKIVTPTAGTAVEEGSTILVEVQMEGDGELKTARTSWPFVGDLGRVSGDSSWPIVGELGKVAVSEPVVPILSNPSTAIASNIPPHVFVGGVTINGRTAPDGTTVSAWVAGGLPSKIVLAATATDHAGNTKAAQVTLELLGRQVMIEETTVVGGNYTLLVGALQGQSFDGRTVYFRVNGIPVRSTGTWLQGGGDELLLSILGS